jgi:ubiquinol-cytochrome c reductase cytochrome b subunit
MRQGVYNGSYTRLGNVPVRHAYASALNINLDVRGGLPVRRIRHWAGDLMLASIMASLLRVFTGACASRARSRGRLGVTLFALAMAEGFPGYSLPDDSCRAPASGSPVTSWKG